jgi:hypothetical protein
MQINELMIFCVDGDLGFILLIKKVCFNRYMYQYYADEQ